MSNAPDTLQHNGKSYVRTKDYFGDEGAHWFVFHKAYVVNVFDTVKEAVANMKTLRGGSTRHFMLPYAIVPEST